MQPVTADVLSDMKNTPMLFTTVFEFIFKKNLEDRWKCPIIQKKNWFPTI